MNTNNGNVTAEDIFRLFCVLKLCRFGNAPKISGTPEDRRLLSPKGREQAEIILRKQQSQRLDLVLSSFLTCAVDMAILSTNHACVKSISALDISEDPIDPLNMMFANLGQSALSEYFKHENAERLRQQARRALSEIVIETAGVAKREPGKFMKVFVSGPMVIMPAILWAIGEVLTNANMKAGENVRRRALEMVQAEGEVIVVQFSPLMTARDEDAVIVSKFSPQ